MLIRRHPELHRRKEHLNKLLSHRHFLESQPLEAERGLQAHPSHRCNLAFQQEEVRCNLEKINLDFKKQTELNVK